MRDTTTLPANGTHIYLEPCVTTVVLSRFWKHLIRPLNWKKPKHRLFKKTARTVHTAMLFTEVNRRLTKPQIFTFEESVDFGGMTKIPSGMLWKTRVARDI